jgi:serine/threonine protein kinase
MLARNSVKDLDEDEKCLKALFSIIAHDRSISKMSFRPGEDISGFEEVELTKQTTKTTNTRKLSDQDFDKL